MIGDHPHKICFQDQELKVESIWKHHQISTISNYQPAVCPKVFGPAFTIHPAPVSSTHLFAVSAAHKPRGQGEARLGAGDR